MKVLCLLGVLALTSIPCHARLGETLDQLVARYGKPISTDKVDDGTVGTDEVVFEKNGFGIVVMMFNGTAGAEDYTKLDKSEFSDTEKQTFLDAEASNQAWNKTQEVSIDEKYVRADGNALCVYQTFSKCFTFYTKDYIQAQQVMTAENEKKKLKDF